MVLVQLWTMNVPLFAVIANPVIATEDPTQSVVEKVPV